MKFVTTTRSIRSYAILTCSLLAALSGGGCSTEIEPGVDYAGRVLAVAGVPATVTPVSGGAGQLGIGGYAFGQELVALVADSEGGPVSNATVTFESPNAKAPGAFFGSAAGPTTLVVSTDAKGLASALPFANKNLGKYAVSATVGALPPASFDLVNGGPASVFSPNSGDYQSTPAGTQFPDALAVGMLDQGGRPMSGAVVTFKAPVAGASAVFPGGTTTATAVTDSTGHAMITPTANGTTGTYVIEASFASYTTQFELENTTPEPAGPPTQIAAQSGSAQSREVGAQFGAPLVAKVSDAKGVGVEGVTVEFSVPSSGASATVDPVSTTTDASGLATVTPTANTVAGNYQVTATATALGLSTTFDLTNWPGYATKIVITGGDEQSAQVNTAFASALTVTVTDDYDNPIDEAGVEFSAPVTEPTAWFGSSSSATAPTDENGVATIAAPTASTKVGSYDVTATVTSIGPAELPSASTTFKLTNTPGPAFAVNQLEPEDYVHVAGVNETFTDPLRAEVVDEFGNLVPGATVNFSVQCFDDEITLSLTSVTSDVDGIVETIPTAGTKADGDCYVEASVDGVSDYGWFTVDVQPGEPAKLEVIGGDGQSAEVHYRFDDNLEVRVTDEYGNGVIGARVFARWPTAGPSAFINYEPISGKGGVVRTRGLLANDEAGTYKVTFTLAGTEESVALELTNRATGYITIHIAPESTYQAARIGTAFAQPLRVIVRDLFGNPVPDVELQFTSSESGASATLDTDTVTTNEEGRASVLATANNLIGAHTVDAAVGPFHASFALFNLPGAPRQIAMDSGSGQSTEVGTAFAQPLRVLVTDSYGAPVRDTLVHFVLPSSGASATIDADLATDESGYVEVTATANERAGSYVVTASVFGGEKPALFELENTPAAGATLTAELISTPQATTFDSEFEQPLVATLRDTYGNPVPDATVTFTAPIEPAGNGGTASAALSASTATTDAFGQAYVTARANSSYGSYVVEASASGVTEPALFNLSNLDVIEYYVHLEGGEDQITNVGLQFEENLFQYVSSDTGQGAVVPVAAHVPSSGASADLDPLVDEDVVTDEGGAISWRAYANQKTGSYPVFLSALGAGNRASTRLTNWPDSPESTNVHLPHATQSAVVNTPYAKPLTVTVVDRFGNPVPGTPVFFTAPLQEPTVHLSSTFAITDSHGQASVVAIASSVDGPVTVLGRVSEENYIAVFSLTNLDAHATRLAIAGGDEQTARVGNYFSSELAVVATDALGIPVARAPVSFYPPDDGPSASLASDVERTNDEGYIYMGVVANEQVGTYKVVAELGKGDFGLEFTLTNIAGWPNDVIITPGSAFQATRVLTEFDNPLEVRVVDQYENPIPDWDVYFEAPDSGATATLSGTSMTTDADGRARVTATANEIAGMYSVLVSGFEAPPFEIPLRNLAGDPRTIEAISGAPASTRVDTDFGEMLEVSVLDENGNPIPDATVTFHAPSTGASAVFAEETVTTDGDGRAWVGVRANTIAGTYAVTATIEDGSSPAVFELTNTPGSPASITPESGSTPQNAQVETAFFTKLLAVVRDEFGNAVPEAKVTFGAPTVGASAVLSDIVDVSDDHGVVRATATANAVLGNYEVTAKLSKVSTAAVFRLGNLASAPVRITIIGGNDQRTVVDHALTYPLMVRVRDMQGNPVAGVLVTVDAPEAGASATFEAGSIYTNASGEAHVPGRANLIAGTYQVSLSVANGATAAQFELTNLPDVPASIAVVAGHSPQSAQVATQYLKPLRVVVKDKHGNVVPEVEVTFDAPSSAVTVDLSSWSADTGANGEADVTAYATEVAGDVTVSASVGGVAAPANFALKNVNGKPSTIQVVSGNDQRALATTEFDEPVRVRVRDEFGNPVPGAEVSIELPEGETRVELQSEDTETNAAGELELRFAAEEHPGEAVVSLSTEGAAAPALARFEIGLIPTQTTLTAPDEFPVDGALAITAHVTTDGLGTPKGRVRFEVGNRVLGTEELDDEGKAVLRVRKLDMGLLRLTATYRPEDPFAGSRAEQPIRVEVIEDAGSLSGGECSVSQPGAAGSHVCWWLLLAVFGLVRAGRRSRRALLAAAIGCSMALLTSGGAAAQAGGLELNRAHPASAGSDWFALDSVAIDGHGRPALRLLADYAKNPLVVYNSNGTRRAVPVNTQLMSHLGGSLVVFEQLRFGVNVPLALYQDGEASRFNGVNIGAPAGGGIGDVKLAADARMFGDAQGPARAAVGVEVGLPTGSQESFLGNGTATAEPRLQLAGDIGTFAWAFRTGVMLRPSTELANVEYGHEMRIAAAVGARVLRDRLLLGPEIWAALPLGGADQVPNHATEFTFGAHYEVTRGLRASAGLGTVFDRAIGNPDLRAVLAVDWAASVPVRRVSYAGPTIDTDRDHDGIGNSTDRCVDQPEDKDGYQDDDGCPELDNDGDHLADTSDQCPNEAEDRDNYRDEDGCPDPDNDGDGVLDVDDACPNEAGVASTDPKKRGCPAPADSDGDGVLDVDDACPTAAGEPTGLAATNGCPKAFVQGSQIKILDQVKFKTGSAQLDMTGNTGVILQAVANVLKEHPEIARVRIEGHTDSRGTRVRNRTLSKARADSVMAWLARSGIEVDRMEAKGFGPDQPIDSNETEGGRLNNRRVEFHIDAPK